MSGPPLTVEFVGLPASGKSTLSRRVAELLAESGIPVRQPSYVLVHGPGLLHRTSTKSFHVLKGVLLDPGHCLVSARAILATRQKSRLGLWKMYFNWLLVSSLLRQSRRESGVVLLDQGIFQAIWSIGYQAEPGAAGTFAKVLGARFPTPAVVVILQAGLETLGKRLIARGEFFSRVERKGGPSGLLQARDRALLEEIQRLVKDVSDRVRPIRILLLSNDRDQDLEANARTLAADLERWFRNLSAGAPQSVARNDAGLPGAPGPGAGRGAR